MTEQNDALNSKINRLRTFYVNEQINSVNKIKFVEKGMYYQTEAEEIICLKCDMTFSSKDNGFISVSIYKFHNF